MEKEAYWMGSCWNKEDISFNGSVTSWSDDDEEEEEVGDVTSSNESESNDEPLEIPDSDSEEKERTTGPLLLLSSPWTTLYFSCSIS